MGEVDCMKHIIFVKDIKSQEDVDKIAAELDNTRVEYTISLATSSVSVEGSNDVVYASKQAISQAGFVVQ